jgi:hypothetical protein
MAAEDRHRKPHPSSLRHAGAVLADAAGTARLNPGRTGGPPPPASALLYCDELWALAACLSIPAGRKETAQRAADRHITRGPNIPSITVSAGDRKCRPVPPAKHREL